MLHNQNPETLEDDSLIPVATMDIAKRQAFGAYYTPFSVATILAKWAIRSKNDNILEPCFGGCDFLEAVKEQIKDCGNPNYMDNIFGCDIDPQAFSHVNTRLGFQGAHSNLILKDFIECRGTDFHNKKFDVVIGNPPYIKSSRLNTKQKKSIQELPASTKNLVGFRANLWAYFILHSLTFLKPNARLAMVLPGNILSSDYAVSLQAELCSQFEKVIAISVSERLFVDQGTEERTVILLCDGYERKGTGLLEVCYCNSTSDLETEINRLSSRTTTEHRGTHKPQLSKSELELFESVGKRSNVKPLGSMATIGIGIVLGDKNFFIKKASEWKKISINEKFLFPVACRTKDLEGIELTSHSVLTWKTEDRRCYFLNTPKRLGKILIEYLQSHPHKSDGENKTFLKRPVWHHPDDGKIAHAFLSGLHDIGPKLVLNTANLQATNSLYRVIFLEPKNLHLQKIAAIGILSTFSQLSAELEGRPMGSGGLKIEPKDGLKIMLPIRKIRAQELEKAFSKVNSFIASGDRDAAVEVADKLFFDEIIEPTEKLKLSKILKRLRMHRRREN
jgi:methylase of polypeptide subunit release factors